MSIQYNYPHLTDVDKNIDQVIREKEKALAEKVAFNQIEYNKDFKGGLNPTQWRELPSWWQITQTDCGQHDCPYPYPHTSCARTCIGEPYAQGYQQQGWNRQEALEFCRLVIKINKDKQAWDDYRCSVIGDSYYCRSWDTGGFSEYAKQLEREINTNAPIHPNLISEFPKYYPDEENTMVMDPSILQSGESVTVTPGVLTWYYVKKPSGICERLNVSQNFVDRMSSKGWIFSLTDICKTDVKCPARVRIINNETNQASGDGFFDCATIERYEENPRYRVEYYDEVTPTPTLTPTPTPTTSDVIPPTVAQTRCYMVYGRKMELTEQAVGYYINQGVSVTPCEAITDEIPPPSQLPPIEEEPVTTDHVTPPDMSVEVPMVTVTPTEPSQVNWIPEPFFSFINNVFRSKHRFKYID